MGPGVPHVNTADDWPLKHPELGSPINCPNSWPGVVGYRFVCVHVAADAAAVSSVGFSVSGLLKNPNQQHATTEYEPQRFH